MQLQSEANMKTDNARKEYEIRARDLRSLAKDETDPDDESLVSDLFVDAAKALEAKQEKLDLMFEHYDLHGLGSTFEDTHGRWAVVLPDATCAGKFRCQYFDKRGFFGHTTLASADAVVLEVCDMGYRKPVPSSTLDTVSQKPEWHLGVQSLALRQAVEDGQMSREEAELKYKALLLKYSPEQAIAV
jgi:hypothetical protein